MRFPIGPLKTSDDLDRLMRDRARDLGYVVVRSDATYDGSGDRVYEFAPAPTTAHLLRVSEETLRHEGGPAAGVDQMLLAELDLGQV